MLALPFLHGEAGQWLNLTVVLHGIPRARAQVSQRRRRLHLAARRRRREGPSLPDVKGLFRVAQTRNTL